MSRYGYGNFKHFRGDDTSIADMVREAEDQARERCAYMKGQLIDLIGTAGFDTWVDETMPEHNITWQEAESYYHAELERYECTCTPDGSACPACQRIYDAQKEN